MNYGRYHRDVSVLSEQSREFAGKDGPISGNLKVETGNNKGAMRCSVENLRPYPKGDYVYKLILFGNHAERTIHAIVGTVPVMRTGGGEAYFRFNPLDADGRGNGYERFTTVIVAAVSTKDGKEPLHPVLKGETGNEPEEVRPWAAAANGKEEGTIGLRTEQKNAGRGETAEAGTARRGTAAWEEAQPETAKSGAGGLRPEAAEPGAGTLRPETAEPGAGGLRPEMAESGARVPRSEAVESGTARQMEKWESGSHPKNFNHFYNGYVLNACIHTCQVAEFYEEVKPFSQDKTGARWKKIVNITNLPLVSPGAHYFASLYHHYLFGAKPNEAGFAASFFFAIPGRRLDAEQPDGGRSGFEYWQPMKGTEGQKSPYGYWIVEIDGETGDIREVSIEKGKKV